MPVDVYVKMSPSFKRTVAKFNEASSGTYTGPRRTIREMTYRAGQMAAAMARSNLKSMVYTRDPATLASVEQGKYGMPVEAGAAKYLMRRRSGRVWRAIKVAPAEAAGDVYHADVFVDRSDFPAYFYAQILNYGGPMGRVRNYERRPFWTNMQRDMRPVYLQLGRLALRQLNGWFRGGSAAFTMGGIYFAEGEEMGATIEGGAG